MDLYAYSVSDSKEVMEYIRKNYGDVPRLRGVRFMKNHDPKECEEGGWYKEFVDCCGKDVIYIHTRCGDCGLGFDNEDSNYVFCGGKKWEEENKDKFLFHKSDEFDATYCDHFFSAVVDEEYNSILAELTRLEKGDEDENNKE